MTVRLHNYTEVRAYLENRVQFGASSEGRVHHASPSNSLKPPSIESPGDLENGK